MQRRGLIIVVVVLFLGAFVFFYGMAKRTTNSNYRDVVYGQSKGKDDVNFSRGNQIYQEKCMSCHQTDGMGVSGVFPPLKGSDFLKNKTKKRLIEQVMNGSNERLVVNGVKYANPMPPRVDNASDAVAVVNYVLNSWGNHYGVATLPDAKGIKKSNINRHSMMGGGCSMH